MFACPNCGGNLKFHIPSQQLACEYCQTQVDPYSFEDKQKDAIEHQEFDATIFTCPQCGGEILSTDQSAAEFCTFCGASTILYSRISKEKRPHYIIPFAYTKEACKNAYASTIKKALFAPDALKDPKYIDGFRGIYMPYWAFYMEQQDSFQLNGTKTHRRGDYIITDHYALHGDIDAHYDGLSFDASSSFDDTISEKIAPYNVTAMKEFTPAYLSGFYADTADVSSDVYSYEAEHIAFNNSVSQIYRNSAFSGVSISSEVNPSALHTNASRIESAMFPVWFLSYRNGDRVAYATINGQTGKVVADLPVDTKKYLIGSLILALPIFVFLNLFFTITPSILLLLTALIAVFANITATVELSRIADKEAGLHDKGRIAKEQPENLSFAKHSQMDIVKPKKSNGNLMVTIVLVLYFIFFFGGSASAILSAANPNVFWVIFPVVCLISSAIGFSKRAKLPYKVNGFGLLSAILAILVGTITALINPVSDIFYYGASIFSLCAVFFTFKDIMDYYNILATRRLPQFDRTGGDDRA